MMGTNTKESIKIIFVVFFTCLLVYLVFWSGHHYSIDGVVMFQYAKSILFRHNLNLDPPIQWGTEITHSTWSLGFTYVYIVVLAILSSTPWFNDIDFSHTPQDPGAKFNRLLLYDPTYRYSSFVNPIITATSAALLYYLCIQLGLSKKRAIAASLIFGIASPAAVYAKLDYAQPLASLLVISALIFFIKARSVKVEYLVVTGIFLGLAVWARTEMIIIPAVNFCAAAFFVQPSKSGGLILWRPGIRNLLLISTPIIASVILNQWINFVRFANPLSVGIDIGNSFVLEFSRVFHVIVTQALSNDIGLVMFLPLTILSFAGLWTLIKNDRLIGFLFLSIFIGSAILYSLWWDWSGGVTWGPRFYLPIIPFILISAFFINVEKSLNLWQVVLFSLLVILGAIATLNGLLFTEMDHATDLVLKGDYHFNISELPFALNIHDLSKLEMYDIRWLDSIANSGSSIRFLIFSGCIFLLGFLLKVWIDIYFSDNQ